MSSTPARGVFSEVQNCVKMGEPESVFGRDGSDRDRGKGCRWRGLGLDGTATMAPAHLRRRQGSRPRPSHRTASCEKKKNYPDFTILQKPVTFRGKIGAKIRP
jgi:hypothetical protein